jgi:hypothetical protein
VLFENNMIPLLPGRLYAEHPPSPPTEIDRLLQQSLHKSRSLPFPNHHRSAADSTRQNLSTLIRDTGDRRLLYCWSDAMWCFSDADFNRDDDSTFQHTTDNDRLPPLSLNGRRRRRRAPCAATLAARATDDDISHALFSYLCAPETPDSFCCWTTTLMYETP